MANRILLNGIDFSSSCLEINEIEDITYQLDSETRTVSKAISSDFSFVGDGYEYLKNVFFGDVSEGCDEIVDVTVIIDCCAEIDLYYQLTHKGVIDCPDRCEMKTTLTKLDTDNKGFNYLNRTRVLDNDAVNNIRTPHLEYCTGEGFRGAGAALFVIFQFVFQIVNLVIIGINFLSPFPDIPLLGDELIDGLLGCDKQAPGIHLKDMFDYQTGVFGMGFQSTTIFDLPAYFHSVMIAMAYEEPDNVCFDLDLIMENRPNVSIISLMDSLAPLYAADFRVRNNTLIFENELWFEDNLVNVGDVQTLEFEELEGICYMYNLTADYASYGRFQYSYDAVDTFGNKFANVYNDIIEWNPTGKDSQEGEHLNAVKDFSPLHIIGQKPIPSNNTTALNLVGHSVIFSGQSSGWKIYTWDGANECKARAVPPDITVPFSTASWNWPYTFIENQTSPSLYDTFHSHKNPEVRPCPMKTDDFEFLTDDFCEMIENLETYGTDIYIDCPYGKLKPNQVTVDLIKKTFTFRDTEIIPYP